MLLILPLPVAAASLRIRLVDVPEPVVQALRQQVAEVEWLDADAAASADLAMSWQEASYQRAVRQHPAEPELLVAERACDSLRAQDAQLIWGPPLIRQVQLAQRLFPGLQRIGIFHRGLGEAEQEALRRAAAPAIIRFQSVNGPLSARDIGAMADAVDVLIASNDERLFNRDTAKLVLLTAYRHQRAWLGPSPAFVHAGALASWATSRASLLQALLERIEQVRHDGRPGGSQQLPANELIGNAQVALSLGLVLPSEMSHD